MRSDYRALVIYNEADNFSAGANWHTPLRHQHRAMAGSGEYGQTGPRGVQGTQQRPPVVGVPRHGPRRRLGNCSIATPCRLMPNLHGFAGVGVIPDWWLQGNAAACCRQNSQGPMVPVARVFETVMSQRCQIGLKRKTCSCRDDGITMNRDRLLFDAKERPALSEATRHPSRRCFISRALVNSHLTWRSASTGCSATAHDTVVVGALADAHGRRYRHQQALVRR